MAIGDSEEMQKAIAMLDEVKESIVSAYELKTGLSRLKISNLMDAETWMNAQKAIELGFADGILTRESERVSDLTVNSYQFSRRAVTNSLLNKLEHMQASKQSATEKPPDETPAEPKYPAEPLLQRLNLLKK